MFSCASGGTEVFTANVAVLRLEVRAPESAIVAPPAAHHGGTWRRARAIRAASAPVLTSVARQADALGREDAVWVQVSIIPVGSRACGERVTARAALPACNSASLSLSCSHARHAAAFSCRCCGIGRGGVSPPVRQPRRHCRQRSARARHLRRRRDAAADQPPGTARRRALYPPTAAAYAPPAPLCCTLTPTWVVRPSAAATCCHLLPPAAEFGCLVLTRPRMRSPADVSGGY